MRQPISQRPQAASERRVLQEVRKRHRLGETSVRASVPPTVRPPSAGKRRGGNPKRRWGKVILLLVALIIAGGSIFGYRILAAGNRISVAEESILGQLKDLLFSSGSTLAGEQENRINILLLAIGGEGHKGENLADTIMVASIRPQDGDVALLSIPRDLFVQVPGQDYFTKINSVHALGEAQKTNGGPELLREKVEEIVGQDIHYYARVDFTAFKSIVDAVGGVNITIESEFYDYWHKISFPAGTEKMSGERALAYVRARYVEGAEGGDFKRAARQQQILLALREKVFSINTAFDFGAVNEILDSLSENIRTDMQLWEMKRFFELARLLKGDNVHSVVLTTGHNGVLVGATELLEGTPASILKPRTGDYSEIQSIAANIFSEEVSKTIAPSTQPAQETATPTPVEEKPAQIAKPTIEIRNGTNINGLAAGVRDELTSDGYEIVAIGNAASRTVEQTVVYQISNTAADGAQALAETLGTSASVGLPEGEAETGAAVLIILGADAEN